MKMASCQRSTLHGMTTIFNDYIFTCNFKNVVTHSSSAIWLDNRFLCLFFLLKVSFCAESFCKISYLVKLFETKLRFVQPLSCLRKMSHALTFLFSLTFDFFLCSLFDGFDPSHSLLLLLLLLFLILFCKLVDCSDFTV